jgi:uncharacterized membrane protein
MIGIVERLSRLPAGVLLLVLVGVGLFIAIGLTYVSERAFDDGVRTRTNTSVTAIVGVIAGLYAVLIAFVIVNEWQSFQDAQTHVSNESAALASASFAAAVLPAPARDKVDRDIVRYARSVVCVELPYLGTHQGPAAATRRRLRQLYSTVADVAPAARNPAFYESTVRSLEDVTQARRARINAASSPLPGLVLAVVVMISLGLIAAVSALDTQHRRWHAFITVALTFIVALNLVLVISLDRPFDGAAKVSDAPLREGVSAALLKCP